MKILLMVTPLHPKLEAYKGWGIPTLAIYVVGSILRNNGFDGELEFYDDTALEKYYKRDGWDETEIEKLIEGCDIIGFSANSFNWGTARELIQLAKGLKNAPFIMCGGVHPTNFSRHILETSPVDLVLCGDAEKNVSKVIDAVKHKKSFHHIPGVSFKNGDQIVANPVKNEKKFIDTPISCYPEMVSNLHFNLPLETSRGCRFNCIFCSVSHRKDWRGLDAEASVEKIRRSLKYIDKIKLNRIFLVDDYFCGDLQRAVDILTSLENIDDDFQISYETRCTDYLNKKIDLAAVISDKTSEIHMGIDAGYDEALSIIGKGFRTRHVHECLKKLSDYGLMKKVTLSTVVGFPWENLSDCLRTIDFVNHIKEKYSIEMYRLHWWMPMISRLWNKQEEYGYHVNETIFDDPTWMTQKDFIYAVHPKLSDSDIEVIDLHTLTSLRTIIGQEDAVKGIEL
jgi:radical SAM superfamily enzyme YgiQ (UPF0313 family)